ncbi:MAG TPA: NAD(P)/FAD-dependent oxidoreductase [Gammaproteobacteria bacterium]|nr:NAD(P)/FAD-dependent oxidoreductase [Gammaproteobacteria bacterium]
MKTEHYDVLIVGAGLSGIGAAYHLQNDCGGRKSYVILESRSNMGGTWDLFRYPGIRSDSDMFTMGYRFRPWTGEKTVTDGPSIRHYILDTARENGIDRHIRFNHRVRRAAWSSSHACWEVEAETGSGETACFSCSFLMWCSGYYRYERGHTPDFPGRERFRGPVVHPQHWPEDFDYRGKRVIVIGSGATAMTLIPAMAEETAHITMLQRSPTYVVSRPDRDAFADRLRKLLPESVVYRLTRTKNIVMTMLFYQLSRRRPETVKKMLRTQLREELGPDFDLDAHFRPRYNPWDQRLCLVPNADLFRALRGGRASVVTDRVESFTGNGIRLQSGRELEADIIVTATGLEMIAFGGAELFVDGTRVEPGKHLSYKGMMLDEVPNLTSVIGYTNASWTLKSELTCEYACRLINYMDRHGYAWCYPHNDDPNLETKPLLDLSSGYVQRAVHLFPRQADKEPWRVHQNYVMDLLKLRYTPVTDEAMQFRRLQGAHGLQRLAS